ncbi:hypothetical protein CIB48_g11633 [Xylaria polymorpha]|nr:hypothetical protein CIB48_g11633 [Xylaria polymorpha]
MGDSNKTQDQRSSSLIIEPPGSALPSDRNAKGKRGNIEGFLGLEKTAQIKEATKAHDILRELYRQQQERLESSSPSSRAYMALFTTSRRGLDVNAGMDSRRRKDQRVFHNALLTYYNLEDKQDSNKRGLLWSITLGEWVPRQMLKAAHIYPYSWGRQRMTELFGDECSGELLSAHQVRLQFRGEQRPRARYLWLWYACAVLRRFWAHDPRNAPSSLAPQLGKGMWGIRGSYLRRDFILGLIEEIGHEGEFLMDGAKPPGSVEDDVPNKALVDLVNQEIATGEESALDYEEYLENLEKDSEADSEEYSDDLESGSNTEEE